MEDCDKTSENLRIGKSDESCERVKLVKTTLSNSINKKGSKYNCIDGRELKI